VDGRHMDDVHPLLDDPAEPSRAKGGRGWTAAGSRHGR